MPIKYVPFIPEPIEGQAVLQNFNRILKYKGADETAMVLQRGMPLYETEKQETVGENKDGNLVIRGECVSACAYLKEQGIEVDLVYIDPPFASGADYAKKVYVRRNPKVAEAIERAEEELDIDELKAFEEKMYGDVWDKEKYLNWMWENLTAIKSIMSPTASIYVELDSHIGHYVKILMDEIFGENNFINEIVWKRTFSHSDVGQGAKHLGRLHDVIFYYSYSEEYTLNTVYTPYSEEYIKNFYKYADSDGRKYRLVSMLGPGGATKGNPRYEVMGVTRYWAFSKESMDKMIATGQVVQNKPGSVPQRKRYLDESEGVPLQDLWMDIPAVQGGALENANYVTQKPEALLERIIKASSNENMLVADFFGGSGVTAAVANKLGRRFIHCDIGINSIQTTRDRLVADGAEFAILEIKDGVQLYRNPVQTMDKIKSLIPGLKNEDSLDAFWEGAVSDSKLGTVPVYVPNLTDSSTKLLDKVLMNRILHQAIPELSSSVKKVIVYYVDITDEEEIRRFIAEDDSTTVEIELRDLKTVLDDAVAEDYAEFHAETVQTDLFGGYALAVNRFVSDRVLAKINAHNEKSFLNSKKDKPYRPIEISNEGLETIEYLSIDATARDGVWHSDSEIKIDKNGYVIRNGRKTKEFWDGKILSEKKPLRLKIRNICGDETVWNVENLFG